MTFDHENERESSKRLRTPSSYYYLSKKPNYPSLLYIHYFIFIHITMLLRDSLSVCAVVLITNRPLYGKFDCKHARILMLYSCMQS